MSRDHSLACRDHSLAPSSAKRAGRARQRGFTLIELLVACALMAVLAVLSWRGLDTVIQSRERLNEASDELRAMTLGLAQLEEDLLRSWPVSGMGLDQPSLLVGLTGQGGGQSIALIREVNRAGLPTRVQRVVYQVQDGQLIRGFGAYASGVGGTGLGGGVGGAVQALVWQPIIPAVRAIHIRGFVEVRGWLDASALAAVTVAAEAQRRAQEAAGGQAEQPGPGTSPAAGTIDPPAITGLELIVERLDGQRFLRVYSVRD